MSDDPYDWQRFRANLPENQPPRRRKLPEKITGTANKDIILDSHRIPPPPKAAPYEYSPSRLISGDSRPSTPILRQPKGDLVLGDHLPLNALSGRAKTSDITPQYIQRFQSNPPRPSTANEGFGQVTGGQDRSTFLPLRQTVSRKSSPSRLACLVKFAKIEADGHTPKEDDMKLTFEQVRKDYLQFYVDLVAYNNGRTAKDYADPKNVLQLKYPRHSKPWPARFKLDISTMTYTFNGRKVFKKLYDEYLEFIGSTITSFYFHGTIGLGKSHLIAALAGLLLAEGRAVVYLPDARELANRFFQYMKDALLLALVRYPGLQKEVYDCKCEADLVDFCESPGQDSKIQLLFIIDQYNGLEHNPEIDHTSNDTIVPTEKEHAIKWLSSITFAKQVLISASANCTTNRNMQHRSLNQKYFTAQSGLDSDEMTHWWERYSADSTLFSFKFSADEKKELEAITGRIPLLLQAIRNPHKRSSSFQGFMYAFMKHGPPKMFADMARQHFVNQIQKRTDNEIELRNYISFLVEVLAAQTEILFDWKFPDYRFIHFRDLDEITDKAQPTVFICGIVWNVISKELRAMGEDVYLNQRMFEGLKHYRDNPSMVGFISEDIILSSLKSKGFNYEDENVWVRPEKIFILRDGEFNFSLNVVKESALYIPYRWNYPAIDAMMIRIQEPEAQPKNKSKARKVDPKPKRVTLFPIQITVADNHSDSESHFFTNIREWLSSFEGENYEVDIVFLWISKGLAQRTEVMEKTLTTRSGTVVINPTYKRVVLPLGDVNLKLARLLKNYGYS